MNTRIALLTVLMLAVPAVALATEESHQHSHDGATPGRLELNEGKKWETDAPLRKSMEGVKKLLEAKIGPIHENKLAAPKYVELSEKITTEINGIFKNCKLAPKADAMLHVILLQIIQGNTALKSAESTADRRAGAIKIVMALGQYPKYFDHPGWKPIRH